MMGNAVHVGRQEAYGTFLYIPLDSGMSLKLLYKLSLFKNPANNTKVMKMNH